MLARVWIPAFLKLTLESRRARSIKHCMINVQRVRAGRRVQADPSAPSSPAGLGLGSRELVEEGTLEG